VRGAFVNLGAIQSALFDLANYVNQPMEFIGVSVVFIVKDEYQHMWYWGRQPHGCFVTAMSTYRVEKNGTSKGKSERFW